jgi:hypothetical protein
VLALWITVSHAPENERSDELDADAKGIAGLLGVIGMLDDDVAAADMIAEAIETCGFAADEFVETKADITVFRDHLSDPL